MAKQRDTKRTVVMDFDPDGPFAAMHLLAVMVAPFDASKRREFLALHAAQVMADAGRGLLFARDDLARYPRGALVGSYMAAVSQQIFVPAGGLAALVKADSVNRWRERHASDWALAAAVGHQLLFAIRLHRFHADTIPSTTRAAEVLYRSHEIGGIAAPALRHKKTMWKRWRVLAPLTGAGHLAWAVAADKGIDPALALQTPGAVRMVLSWAAWLQDEARRLKTRGAVEPILPASEGLQFPEGLRPEEPPLCPLPEELLDAAVHHDAPIAADRVTGVKQSRANR
jgi:hypothetical protein